MIVTKCIINLGSHSAHVQVDDRGLIQVFKYNSHSCDFDIFSHDEQLAASDYIITALPTTYYSVTVPGDDIPLLK